jgi:hypothetical protein
VMVRLHRGIDLSVERRQADMAICHYITRAAAEAGDVIVGISAVASWTFVEDPGHDRAVWPRPFWEAVRGLSGARAATWAMQVKSKFSLEAYHCGMAAGPRQTAILKPNGDGEFVPKSPSHARLPLGGLDPYDCRGNVLLGATYARYASNLEGAPLVPEAVRNWLSAKHFGRGHRVAEPGDASAAQARFWAAAVLRQDATLGRVRAA